MESSSSDPPERLLMQVAEPEDNDSLKMNIKHVWDKR